MKRNKVGTYLGNFSIAFALVFGLVIFLFALLSGAEAYGGGFTGILKNSPNALPWALFLVLVFVAWKWRLFGGILMALLGIGLLYLFGIPDKAFQAVTLIIALIPVLLGLMLILSWGLMHNRNED